MKSYAISKEIKSNMPVYSHRIGGLMEKYSYSNKKLADKIQVSEGQIWNILHKEGYNPNIYTFIEIAKVFNVSTDYLLGLAKEPTTNAELNDWCEYTGLIQSSVEFLMKLNNYNIGDTIHNPVDSEKDLIGQITCEYDKPMYIINLLLNNPRIIGYIYSYLCIFNDDKSSVYQGDKGSSILFELMIQLRKLRDEFQPIYKEAFFRFYEDMDGYKKDGENNG